MKRLTIEAFSHPTNGKEYSLVWDETDKEERAFKIVGPGLYTVAPN